MTPGQMDVDPEEGGASHGDGLHLAWTLPVSCFGDTAPHGLQRRYLCGSRHLQQAGWRGRPAPLRAGHRRDKSRDPDSEWIGLAKAW